MTISELGSLGEFVSALAVLITLIYLSVQVRQAKREAVTTQAQLRQDSGRAMLMQLTQPALGSLIWLAPQPGNNVSVSVLHWMAAR